MHRLHNLSIKSKFILIVFPLIAGIIYLVSLKTNENYVISQNMVELQNGVQLSVKISYVVHEIQKERGNSSGFLSNKGEAFGAQLNQQRILTDASIAAFEKELSQPRHLAFVRDNNASLTTLQEFLDRIPDLRKTVNTLSFTPNEAIDAYTEINTYALNYLSRVIPNSGRSDIAVQIQSYFNFLKSKERAGIERAIGAQGFSLGQMNGEVYKRFSTLVAAQDSYMDAFMSTSDQEAKDFYSEAMAVEAVEEVERMRQLLYANTNLSESPTYWFSTITTKIEQLKKVENYLAERVISFSSDLANEANSQFWAFLVATIALIALDFLLLFNILFRLLGSIQTLSLFTTKVAGGKLGGAVEVKSKDELGAFAGTLNTMISRIRIAQKQLNKEKIKAQHLYQTTYKTSEVVFANVDQGIFLVNTEMTISKLYSKAMERIFGQENIADVNFLDLLNPMLVPRDREALQVFVKHLFNPRVKDNVLKKLNPVEQVQIFSGSKGDDEALVNKYIRISFSRIVRNGSIENVMVTVLDETQSVLLQKQIKENEEKNKQETEQLLNIIKINPVALREYLDNAQSSLDEIYERYENYKSKDFDSLAKFTFNIIHSLKGNASLIELDLMEDKFHSIEEALVRFRGTKIEGSDFLKVLYEINEVKMIMTNVGSMLRKIAEIYYKSSTKEEIFSNDRLIGSFQRAVKRLGGELGKKAELIFENKDDVVFPEKSKLLINDIIVQLIRNTMAHGIESPSERLSNGKGDTGSINIAVRKGDGGHLELTYTDDGQGLDSNQILARAKKIGLIEEEKAYSLDKSDILTLIFEDGFSTNENPDIHSGRGQGMSVIKSTVEKMGGKLKISTEKGKQFTMSFTLPLAENVEVESVQF